LSVRNCEFSGALNNAVQFDGGGRSGQLEVADCLSYGAKHFLVTSDQPRDLSVRIAGNTFLGIHPVNHYHAQASAPPASGGPRPVRFVARHNVFDSQAVLTMSPLSGGELPPAADQALAAQRMSWQESRNVHSGALMSFNDGRGKYQVTIRELGPWNEFWQLTDTGSLHGRLRYQGGNLRARLVATPGQLTAADFRLHPDSSGKGAGEGGRDVGVDVDDLGPGPAFERWRASAEYQAWRVATRQAPDPEPFVVLADAERREVKFAALADAVDFAAPGDVIEIRSDGPLAFAPVSIRDKALTIRAGIGWRPVLEPDAAAVRTGMTQLLNTNAPLVLEGLELRNLAPDDAPSQPPLLAAYKGTLRLAHCRFHLQSKPDGAPAVHARSLRFEARNCQFAGAQARAAVDWRPPPGGKLDLEDCLLHNRGSCLFVIPDDRDFTDVQVRLAHNTFYGTGAFGFYFDETKDPPAAAASGPISVELSENVLDAPILVGFGRTLSEPMKLELASGLDMLRQRLKWQDQGNLHRPIKTYVHLSHDVGGKGTEFQTGIASLAEWLALWPAASTGSLESLPKYVRNELQHRYATQSPELQPEDFRLQPGSPGHGAGEDGRDLGADVGQIGPGPAYDSWRTTPEYQDWLKNVAK
jgi:hypothetical protein